MVRSWEELLAHAERHSDYTAELKAELRRCVPMLRELLGTLPRGSFALANQAPWTRWRLVWLAKVLHGFTSCEGCERVLRRLRQRESCREALEVLQAAEPFHEAGLAVTFEPTTVIGGRVRSPDLRVDHLRSGEHLYVEVTHLFMPQVMRSSTNSMVQWSETVLDSQLRYGGVLSATGRWVRWPLEEEQRSVIQQLDRAAQEAQQRCGMSVCSIPGLVEIAFGHPQSSGQIEAWAKYRDLEPGHVAGPLIRHRENERMRSTIAKKAMQLPPDEPGVVMIHNHRAGVGQDSHGIPTFSRTEVLKHLQAFPHILAVVVCAEEWTWSEPSWEGLHRPRWNSVATRRPFPDRSIQYEFVWNAGFSLTYPRACLQTMYRGILEHHRSKQCDVDHLE